MLLNYLRTVLYSDESVNLIWCEDIFFRGLSKDIPNKFLMSKEFQKKVFN